MQEHGIPPIDVVVVNLYPFESTVADPACSFEEAIEQIDIGGPSMLRSAAKNHADVVVMVDPNDYQRVLEALRAGGVPSALRRELAQKVFAHTSRYDGIIAEYLSRRRDGGTTEKFPTRLSLTYERSAILRYGENPHQEGALYRERGGTDPSISGGRQLHGKTMSYNNYLDADSALELVKEFADAAVVIIKHNNPCGAALGGTAVDAYVKARETDPVSAFGGVIACNRTVDLAMAKEVTTTFVEVLVAPEFTADALAELQRKKDLRLLSVGPLDGQACKGYDLKKTRRRVDRTGSRLWNPAGRDRVDGADHAAPHRDGIRGLCVCMESVQAREVQRHCVGRGHADHRHRRRTDEPRGFR